MHAITFASSREEEEDEIHMIIEDVGLSEMDSHVGHEAV